MKLIHSSRHFIFEAMSAALFLIFAVYVEFTENSLDTNHADFWVIILSIFCFLQACGLIFKQDLLVLRLCMAWVAGITWSWLGYASYNPYLATMLITVGIGNIYSFTEIINTIEIDWEDLRGTQ